MLYWLSTFSDTIGPLNVLRYITFRTGGAMITAFIFVFLFGSIATTTLRLQQSRAVPGGGLVILLAFFVATLLWANPANRYLWIVMGVALGAGALGFCHEWLRTKPLSALSDNARLAMMAGIALAACLALAHQFAVEIGWLFIATGVVVIVAAGNVVNLADKLHGSVVAPLLVAAVSFGFIAYLTGNAIFARYLGIEYAAGLGELAVLCGALIGAGMGSLWLGLRRGSNYVGDGGSLALGSTIGTVAVTTRYEVVLALISVLFMLKPASAKG
jgi:phospho-N-acetylmuramoyl-pentapeptide-transferase